jgi:Chlorophyll A-B binding protein
MKKSLICILLPFSATNAFCPGAGGQLSKTTRDSRPRSSTAVSNQESSIDPSSSSSSLLETENFDQNQPPNNDEANIIMSKALPFLPCPPVLRDSNFAGNVGFDPLGFAQSTEQLWHYREAEIKHARLAMLVRSSGLTAILSHG